MKQNQNGNEEGKSRPGYLQRTSHYQSANPVRRQRVSNKFEKTFPTFHYAFCPRPRSEQNFPFCGLAKLPNTCDSKTKVSEFK